MHYSCWLTNRSCARVVIAGAMVMACQSLALAMINLRFTPADLVRGSAQVAVVELTAPKNHRIAVKVTEMIKGDKLPENALIIDTADAPNATLQELKEILGNDTATKALVLTSRIKVGPGSKNPAAMLCVGTKWFAPVCGGGSLPAGQRSEGLRCHLGRWRTFADHGRAGCWEGSGFELPRESQPNLNAPQIVSITPWDINADGRQGVALFYAGIAPKCFFNRGFGCFGLARELLIDNNLLAPRRTTKNLRPPPA